ncbi:MAG: hypothetical protein A2508_10320 [Candidatus Lambdaproteobacteria bacterium RIFOXYD12_FULL_49_8]|uniref:Lysozyme n=1 Tax=Candidatus Lambdaproteobacteria bacterium RIFOXYD2_FULL_50_16 TaxID=1817772 RepID=A0A1F6G645_9PROT|nr:MAG: hypothetical protein A2527_11755 [Candidatus Lambdaproteobacteria bacterium RIFOXYD2_FULL_50_16]OGG98420.1 MAG: hypothetical protein A2508_10320 [Candidatus Lambdaproteobacteria bacterium RIFOXYD12_FULL_49_8]
MDRTSRNNLKRDLLRFEGLRLKPYLCPAGKLTLGVGRNLEDCGISQEEAEYLLENDLNRVLSELESQLNWFGQLPGEAQEVLANMAFNLGIHGLMGFNKTLEAFKQHDWKNAAKEMQDSLWARQTGPRALELASKIRDIEQKNKSSLDLLVEIKDQIFQLEKRIG